MVSDQRTAKLRSIWKDVSQMTYSKEDKVINDLKAKNKAKFDTLKGIINNEKTLLKEQKSNIDNLKKESNIKFISSNSD